MELNVKFEFNDTSFTIHNLTEGDIEVELINIPLSYVPAATFIIKKGWYNKVPVEHKNINNKHNINYIHIVDCNRNLHCYSFDNEIIEKKRIEYNFKFSSPLVCISGHSGGGTSIVAKSLRYFGVHLGDDAGRFENRKNHESVAMRRVLMALFKETEDEDRLKDLVHQGMVGYKYKNKKINAFKLTNISEVSKKINQVFPNIKFLSIQRQQNKNHFTTPEGRNFQEKEIEKINKEIFLPLEGAPLFVLEWEKYFSDYKYAQKVLNYIGLDIELTPNRFKKMLDDIKFDNKKLAQTLHNS